MTIATVTTDINMGPFIIPSNGQNMIMNNYAQRNNLKVELVIPEPIMSNKLATVEWLNKEFNFSKIILCSIYQLPNTKNISKVFLDTMKNAEFHFAIEGIKGKGKEFLLETIQEAKTFMNADKIDSTKTNWLELYDMLNKNDN